MPRCVLSEKFVKTVRADPKRQVPYFDQRQPGLVLCVNPGRRLDGQPDRIPTKSWLALWYINSKPRYRKLGTYPVWSVERARDEVRRFLDDPHKALSQEQDGTFSQVAATFLQRHVAASRTRPALRSQREIKRYMNKYVFPNWRDRHFRKISRADVTALLDRIEDKHGTAVADATLGIIRKIFRWYQARNDDYVCPVVPGMKRDTRSCREKARDRILKDEETRSIWRACKEMGQFGRLLKLALLTGQRREKLASMKWTEIVDGVWLIPTEPREKGNGGDLQLSELALKILSEQPRVLDNPFIFGGSKKGQRNRNRGNIVEPPHFNSWSQRKAELDVKLPPDIPHWTIHDLRRTARSLMSRAGVTSEIAERVLGHAIMGVQGVYNRHQYEAEKALALQKLADLISLIVEPSNVNVSMARAAE